MTETAASDLRMGEKIGAAGEAPLTDPGAVPHGISPIADRGSESDLPLSKSSGSDLDAELASANSRQPDGELPETSKDSLTSLSSEKAVPADRLPNSDPDPWVGGPTESRADTALIRSQLDDTAAAKSETDPIVADIEPSDALVTRTAETSADRTTDAAADSDPLAPPGSPLDPWQDSNVTQLGGPEMLNSSLSRPGQQTVISTSTHPVALNVITVLPATIETAERLRHIVGPIYKALFGVMVGTIVLSTLFFLMRRQQDYFLRRRPLFPLLLGAFGALFVTAGFMGQKALDQGLPCVLMSWILYIGCCMSLFSFTARFMWLQYNHRLNRAKQAERPDRD
ncbi:hypothetical protein CAUPRSCDRAFT_12221 [Caulochytrium protostelioides]|uniref:Uncharacterized protein n=1 Tax=Caulochytrium protostelioides TaxID=1555241 RepID=A0A4P9WS91_9FUNG|nr:hypothetical protein CAUPRSCDRAFT_12221 [Caulochytrium protostelioides]